MQVDIPSLTASSELLTVAVLSYLAGAACPVYYAEERLRGFGRVMLSRLPYAPPPGMEESEAMETAARAAEGVEVDCGGEEEA